jgi:transcriptional regulator with XRE-family HTH domain
MRVAAGFSNAGAAARIVGCSRVHLLNIERGASGASKPILERIAKAYGVTLADIDQAIRSAREDLLKRLLEDARAEK